MLILAGGSKPHIAVSKAFGRKPARVTMRSLREELEDQVWALIDVVVGALQLAGRSLIVHHVRHTGDEDE
jgi:hypothetical protein